MKYVAKLKGEFEVTQECEANSEEEARQIFSENRGTDIESTAISMLEIESIVEVE